MRWMFFVVVLAALPLPGAAQQVIRGRVFAGAQPVPNQPVSLHRVTATGGATLAVDTTADDGLFEMRYEPGAGEAVFFVATRYEDQLYIGETFRQPFQGEYRVPVGPGATPIDLSATSGPAQPPAPQNDSSRTAGMMVILVSAIVLGGLVLLAARPRAANTRRLLVEIADLDNRNDEAPVTNYKLLRSDLLRRLRESA
jgi:hypothetical protein